MASNEVNIDASILLDIYERAARIRKNDEAFHASMQSGKLGIRIYYSPRGQEIIPASICNLLTDEDGDQVQHNPEHHGNNLHAE